MFFSFLQPQEKFPKITISPIFLFIYATLFPSANKLAFKGAGSSFSEKRRGIQFLHTKAFFLPYNDVGPTGACRVAGRGA